MPWNVTHHPSQDFICTVFAGETTAADLRAAAGRRIKLHRTTGTRLALIDVTEMRRCFGEADLYNLPARHYAETQAERRVQLAILAPASGTVKEAAEFFAIACFNRGWSTEVFTEKARAFEWLGIRKHEPAVLV